VASALNPPSPKQLFDRGHLGGRGHLAENAFNANVIACHLEQGEIGL
jgi:hypothetical protein